MRYWSTAALAVLLCAAPLPAVAQDLQLAPPAVSEAPQATETPAATPAPDTTGNGQFPVAPAPLGGLADPTSVRSLFGHLRSDLRRAATRDNALIMVGFGAAAAVVHPYDARLTTRISTARPLEHVFDGGQIIGGTLVQVGGSIATYAIGRTLHRPQLTLIGADLVRAQLLNTVFTQGLKLSLNRARPDGDPFSLPSGHSSGTFATATVLQRHLGWKAGVPAYALAAYVAGSRLQERRHYASDVILGAGIGIVSGRAVTVGSGRNRFTLAPMAVPGRGAGVTFTRLAN